MQENLIFIEISPPEKSSTGLYVIDSGRVAPKPENKKDLGNYGMVKNYWFKFLLFCWMMQFSLDVSTAKMIADDDPLKDGQALYAKGEFQEAATQFSKAISANPDNWNAYHWRGASFQRLGNYEKAAADRTTGMLVQAGSPTELPEENLEALLRKHWKNVNQASVVICVPQFQELAEPTLHLITNGRTGKEYFRCKVSSEAIWNKCVSFFTAQSTYATSVAEFDVHETPYFQDSRGVAINFEIGQTRVFKVAPRRKLKLTPEVLKYFRVIRESDYMSDRTAIIITEGHDSLDQQIASFRGLEALLTANPWLRVKGETAFLVEAWDAYQPLSISPLKGFRPRPSDRLVMASLSTFLIPSYVAIEWKHGLGIPLIGHEDFQLYKLCNWLHWACHTGFFSGKDLQDAKEIMGSSVVARNQSSANTFLAALQTFNCPILYIGWGHVGPYEEDHEDENDAINYRKKLAERLRELAPDARSQWLTTVSQKSVASYLKKNNIGFVLLEPRADAFLDYSIRNQLDFNYTALRKTQHDGIIQPLLDNYTGTKSHSKCTTMPDPGSLAKLLPALERSGFPNAELFTSASAAEELGNVLRGCASTLGCFTAGTLVRTMHGLRRIESLEANDLVLGCNTETGQWGFHPIVDVLHTEYSGDMVTFFSADGTQVRVTGSHPFFRCSEKSDSSGLPKGSWINARDLRPGDLLGSANGKPVEVKSLGISPVRQPVFTLRVAEVHTFAVTDAGLLVHNHCNWVPAPLFRDPKFEKNLVKYHQSFTPSFQKPKESAAHHLIPVAEAQQSELMKAAARLGYNINRGTNGMFLPSTEASAVAMQLPLHRGNHQSYSDYVASRLKRLDSEFRRSARAGKSWNRDRIFQKVRNLEKDLKRQLRLNKFDLED